MLRLLLVGNENLPMCNQNILFVINEPRGDKKSS